ncbi:MAG TPA: 1,4-dihydroxy-2-naphthoate polyprenyltransferase [Solirubrobacteraceae bacterium]|nr:1,4-dihydroxy-2-naphthoate polyprenyltransferase [Solirubrobacteraceae bacterium]
MSGTASAARPSGLRIWLMASRPRTLPAGLSPVLVGTALADSHGAFHILRFLAALIGALLIQVGANLSNDYSDARRGADTEDRLGPVRVTAGGLVPPRQVLMATYITFGLALLVGVYLVVVAGWQLLLIGLLSIAAGVLYTGGPRPYGYDGLGEVFVFLFFGVVAVAGSYFVETRHLDYASVALAVPVGLLAAAILVVNNTRDIDTDRRANKRTLAVRMGRENSRRFYAALLLGAYGLLAVVILTAGLSAWALIALLSLPLARRLIRTVMGSSDGPTLNGVLAGTGQLQLVFCVLVSAGLLIGH